MASSADLAEPSTMRRLGAAAALMTAAVFASRVIGYLREAEGASKPGDPTVEIVRWHLAQAYEANGEADRARETIARAVNGLDDLKKRQTDPAATEPPWATQIRTMSERLGPATASPAEAAAGQG